MAPPGLEFTRWTCYNLVSSNIQEKPTVNSSIEVPPDSNLVCVAEFGAAGGAAAAR
jgi:hypothetical protein